MWQLLVDTKEQLGPANQKLISKVIFPKCQIRMLDGMQKIAVPHNIIGEESS